MYLLKTEATFDSAHFLRGYNGKCANLHGHTWRVEVTVGSDTLTASGEQRGMVIDFADLKNMRRPKTVLCMRRTDHAVCSGTICEY